MAARTLRLIHMERLFSLERQRQRGRELSRGAGLDDIGRPARLTDNQDSGYGLVNDSDPDDGDTDMDDVDDGDFDDNAGGSEDV